MMKKLTALILACIFVVMAAASAVEYKELKIGSKDSGSDWAVYSLQKQLIDLGYLSGGADGAYGKNTAEAIKNFQRAAGLEITGVADPETQEALYAIRVDSTPAPDDSESGLQPGVPGMGDKGADVMIVQGMLYKWGFSATKADGLFGQKTKEALSIFQKYALEQFIAYNDMKPTPAPVVTPEPEMNEFGFYEMPALEEQIFDPNVKTDGVLTSEWLDFMEHGFEPIPTGLSFKLNDKDPEVRRMQRRLAGLGYIPAEPDGVLGEHTEVALKYFQKLNDMDVTGVLDETTMRCLYSGEAVPSDKYITKYKAMVSVTDQRVYIYEWTGNDYTALKHTFLCSTGTKQNPTILGTFNAPGRNGEWYYMEDSKVWVKYAFVIDGGYFFHSVLFEDQESEPTASSIKKLGTRASHGCIRLSVEDAKWIYDNCSNGMTVVIYDDDEPETTENN